MSTWEIPDYQHKEDQKTAEMLRSCGYVLDVTSDGYSVKKGEMFVCGAGIMLPRSAESMRRRRNGKAAKEDVRMYLQSAIRAAIDDQKGNP